MVRDLDLGLREFKACVSLRVVGLNVAFPHQVFRVQRFRLGSRARRVLGFGTRDQVDVLCYLCM